MAYCTTAQVKTYLGLTTTGDDTLIGTLIDRAQAWIDNSTNRTFETTGDTTRRFTVGRDTDGQTLYFDEDCASITTITNLADGTTSQQETISATQYITHPRNFPPYFAVTILDSADKEWDYIDDPEMGITVAGDWAYSTAPDNAIVHACVRLAGYLYRQKDSQVFNTTAIPDAGVIEVPFALPPDVEQIIAPYRRRAEW